METENQIVQQLRLRTENKDMFELPPLKLKRFGKLALRYVRRDEFLMSRCRGKRVLHIGCSSAPYTEERIAKGTHLHQRLMAVASELYGIDLSREGLEIMEGSLRCGNLFLGDAERLGDISLSKSDFDVILAGDILEHLNNPGLFIEGVTRFMSSYTQFIISTNNAFSLANFVRLLAGGFHEGTGHVIVNSPATLSNLLDRHHLQALEILTAYQRKPPARMLPALVFGLGKTFLTRFPAVGGTLIVVAQLAKQ
jgi:2-polyprenyl-3-methyl-5-hydroxy-6-metoxy-1,4-benzoquinol methylase